MDVRAIEKARSRLGIAERQLAAMQASQTYRELADNWYVFLASWKNVYTVLEQGAKTSPHSRQWFGAKARIRKQDPLLQYIYQARNDDEHGLGSAVQLRPEMHEVGVAKPGFSSNMRLGGASGSGPTILNARRAAALVIGDLPSGAQATSLDGKPVLYRRTPATTILVPVRDRGGKVYHPPSTHLEEPVHDKSPIGVAKIALSYLKDLVAEASSLA